MDVQLSSPTPNSRDVGESGGKPYHVIGPRMASLCCFSYLIQARAQTEREKEIWEEIILDAVEKQMWSR